MATRSALNFQILIVLAFFVSINPQSSIGHCQFLTEIEVAETQCYAASDQNGGPYPLYEATFLIDEYTQVPTPIATFVGHHKRVYELNCFDVIDKPPLDVPSHLAETCASGGNLLSLAQVVVDANGNTLYPIESEVNYFDVKPTTQLSFGGRNERPIKTRAMLWAPVKAYTSPACYPRYLTVIYSGGLVPEKSNPAIAYIIIGVIAGVMGVVAIAVFAYLLHRRMNTFMLRGEKLGVQKYAANIERYGPGDEDPDATKVQERDRHLQEMAQFAPQYAATEEVEIEKGVFVSRRIDLYRDDNPRPPTDDEPPHLNYGHHNHDGHGDYPAGDRGGVDVGMGPAFSYEGLNNDVMTSDFPNRYQRGSAVTDAADAYSPPHDQRERGRSPVPYAPSHAGYHYQSDGVTVPTRDVPGGRLHDAPFSGAVVTAPDAMRGTPAYSTNYNRVPPLPTGKPTISRTSHGQPLPKPWYDQMAGEYRAAAMAGLGGQGGIGSPNTQVNTNMHHNQGQQRRSGSAMLQQGYSHSHPLPAVHVYDGPPDRI